jgi:hypothetical protein
MYASGSNETCTRDGDDHTHGVTSWVHVLQVIPGLAQGCMRVVVGVFSFETEFVSVGYSCPCDACASTLKHP